MQNIRLKLNYFLLLLFISIFFIQCKSVDITILGVFNKKYGKQAEQLNSDSLPETNTKAYALVTVSGEVTDTENKAINGADVYIIKTNRIISHTKSDSNGKYQIKDIKPDVYFIHVIAPAVKTHQREELKINPDMDLSQVNFKFKTEVK